MSLEDVVMHSITRSLRTAPADGTMPRPVAAEGSAAPSMLQELPGDADLDPDDALVRQHVKRPDRLRGEDAEARRARENREALGGMRSPRVSNLRASGHRAVGKKASRVLSAMLWKDDAVETAVISALGDKTKKNIKVLQRNRC